MLRATHHPNVFYANGPLESAVDAVKSQGGKAEAKAHVELHARDKPLLCEEEEEPMELSAAELETVAKYVRNDYEEKALEQPLALRRKRRREAASPVVDRPSKRQRTSVSFADSQEGKEAAVLGKVPITALEVQEERLPHITKLDRTKANASKMMWDPLLCVWRPNSKQLFALRAHQTQHVLSAELKGSV